MPATGKVTDDMLTMPAKVGFSMSRAATFKRSPAVDWESWSNPLGSA